MSAAKAANDPHYISDGDHTGDQPQECAGSGIECQADAQAQREYQEGGSEDRHVQDDSQNQHAAMILQQLLPSTPATLAQSATPKCLLDSMACRVSPANALSGPPHMRVR